MQSADYVPGVSGWKMTEDLIEINGGPLGPLRIGNLDRPEVRPSNAHSAEVRASNQDLAKQFVVVDGVTYINQALIESSAIKARNTEEVSARASADEVSAGRIGALQAALEDWKPTSQFLVSAEPYVVTMQRHASGQYLCAGIGLGVDQALQMLCSKISESELGLELQAKIDAVETVRDVIRTELRPGGLLHRR